MRPEVRRITRWSPGRSCRCTASASMLVARDRMPGAGRRGPGPPECVVVSAACTTFPPVLLVVDVGNTQTHLGTFAGGELVEHWRFATVRESTADELGARLRALLDLRGFGFADVDASIVSSTVPQLRPEWSAMAQRYLRQEMAVVGPGLRTGMPIRYDNPREIGPDR